MDRIILLLPRLKLNNKQTREEEFTANQKHHCANLVYSIFFRFSHYNLNKSLYAKDNKYKKTMKCCTRIDLSLNSQNFNGTVNGILGGTRLSQDFCVKNIG